jgi:hypothetical protein
VAPLAPEAREANANGALHGGMILVADDGSRFELVRDAHAGTLTVFALGSSDRRVLFEQAPVLVLENGTEVALVAVPGQMNVWRATNDAFRAASFSGSLRVTLDGKTSLIAIRPTAQATVDEKNVPASSSRPAEAPMKAHDGVRTEGRVSSEPAKPVTSSESAKPAEAPAPAATAKVKAEPAAEKPVIRVQGTAPAAADDRGTVLMFGDNVARYHLRRDESTGRVILSPAVESEAIMLQGTPKLIIETPGGKRRELEFQRGEGSAWTVQSNDLKATTKGTVRIRVQGKDLEATMSGTTRETPAPAPAQPAPEEHSRGTEGSGWIR